MNRLPDNSELVLSLHGIGTPMSGLPADEIPYWIDNKRFADVVAAAQAWSQQHGAEVLVTFDDGNRSDLAVAAPLLARHGLGGAFFVCTGRLDHPDYLSRGDLRELVRLGFTVGSHGIDHLAWPSLSPEHLAREIGDSRAILEDALGAAVTTAAIPFGAYNRRVLAALRANGYTAVFNSDRGISPRDRWMRRRWTWHTGEPFEFDAMVSASRSLPHRLKVGAKEVLKSLR